MMYFWRQLTGATVENDRGSRERTMSSIGLRTVIAIVVVSCRSDSGIVTTTATSATPPASTPSPSAPPTAAAPAVADVFKDLAAKARTQGAGIAPEGSEGSRYWGSHSEKDVLEAIGRGGSSGAKPWQIADWKAHPGSLVAASLQLDAAASAAHRVSFRVVVLESQSGRLNAVATGTVAPTNAPCETGHENDSAGEPVLELDLAPYTIAAGNTAIGVRLECHHSYAAGEGGETRLFLLERHENAVRCVFEGVIAASEHDRAGGSESDDRGVVIVQKTLHDDHFDLTVRTTKTIRDDGTGARSRKPGSTTQAVPWIWRGSAYFRANP